MVSPQSVAKRYKAAEPVKLQNRFEPLAEQESPNSQEEGIGEEKAPVTADKIPPTYLSADNFKGIIKDLEDQLEASGKCSRQLFSSHIFLHFFAV